MLFLPFIKIISEKLKKKTKHKNCPHEFTWIILFCVWIYDELQQVISWGIWKRDQSNKIKSKFLKLSTKKLFLFNKEDGANYSDLTNFEKKKHFDRRLAECVTVNNNKMKMMMVSRLGRACWNWILVLMTRAMPSTQTQTHSFDGNNYVDFITALALYPIKSHLGVINTRQKKEEQTFLIWFLCTKPYSFP